MMHGSTTQILVWSQVETTTVTRYIVISLFQLKQIVCAFFYCIALKLLISDRRVSRLYPVSKGCLGGVKRLHKFSKKI